MAATADPSVLSSVDHIKALSQIGFGDATRTRCDFSLAQQVCVALNCVADVGFSSKRDKSVHTTKSLVNDIVNMISSPTWKSTTTGAASVGKKRNEEAQWYGATQQGVHAIFHLSARPEEACEAIVKTLSNDLFSASAGKTKSSSSSSSSSSNLAVSPLARFVFVLGEIAIGQLAHMERLAVATKRRRLDHEENGGSAAINGKKGKVAAATKGKKKKNQKEEEEEEESEDEGLDAMMGNNDQEADKELELYEQIAHKLVSEGSNTMLSKYTPLVVQVARCLVTTETDVSKGPMLRLQESVSLTLCKFMCISEKLCEENLKLLFTALQRCKAPSVRCNIVVSLGDLYSRFPNSLTPWSKHLFERLHDEDVSVRKVRARFFF